MTTADSQLAEEHFKTLDDGPLAEYIERTAGQIKALRDLYAAACIEKALRRYRFEVGERVHVRGKKAESFTIESFQFVWFTTGTSGSVVAWLTPHYKKGTDGLTMKVSIRDLRKFVTEEGSGE